MTNYIYIYDYPRPHYICIKCGYALLSRNISVSLTNRYGFQSSIRWYHISCFPPLNKMLLLKLGSMDFGSKMNVLCNDIIREITWKMIGTL